jgi:hypothetical protein
MGNPKKTSVAMVALAAMVGCLVTLLLLFVFNKIGNHHHHHHHHHDDDDNQPESVDNSGVQSTSTGGFFDSGTPATAQFTSVGVLFVGDWTGTYQRLQCDPSQVIGYPIYSCTASLVDSDALLDNLNTAAGQMLFDSAAKQVLRRRLILTARHCTHKNMNYTGQAIGNIIDTPPPFDPVWGGGYISFDYNGVDPSGRIRFGDVSGACTNPNGILTNPAYTANVVNTSALTFYKVWTLAGGGINDDIGLMITDNPIPSSVARDEHLVKIQLTKPNEDSKWIYSNTLIGVGYGISGYGKAGDNLLGTPTAQLGLRQRRVIEMKFKSVTRIDLNLANVYARGDDTTCNGDSGAPALTIEPITGRYVAHGALTSGDPHCRATSVYTLIGNAWWQEWAVRVFQAYLSNGLVAAQSQNPLPRNSFNQP